MKQIFPLLKRLPGSLMSAIAVSQLYCVLPAKEYWGLVNILTLPSTKLLTLPFYAKQDSKIACNDLHPYVISSS